MDTKQIKIILESFGLEYVGIQLGFNKEPVFVLFNDKIGSTRSIDYNNFSYEAVKNKLSVSLDK